MNRLLPLLSLVAIVQGTFTLSTLFTIIGPQETINISAVIRPHPNPGSVTFTDNNKNIKTVALTKGGGQGTALLQYTAPGAPPPGTSGAIVHQIGATSTGQTPPTKLAISVVQGSSRLSLVPSKTTYALGTLITATATVTKGAGQTFTFQPNKVIFQFNGVAVTCNPPVPTQNPFTCKFKPTINTTGPAQLLAYYPGDSVHFYGGSVDIKYINLVCPTGLADCNGDNICETNTTNDPANCGSCSHSCALSNTLTTCTNSNCVTTGCQAGFGDCNATVPGCETNTNTDLANCGGCNQPCNLAHADSVCSGGNCEVSSCDAGFSDCPGANSPGCQTDIHTVANCGTCGNNCSTQNGVPSCPEGTCEITCNQGFADCDATVGCEFTCDAFAISTVFNSSVTTYPSTLTCTDAVADMQNATLPRRGTGDANGEFVIATRSGVELGLRAEERIVGNILPLGQTVYPTIACPSKGTTPAQITAGGSSVKARWNYGISVDLRRGTGPYAGKTFNDFDITLNFTALVGSNPYPGFPYSLDVKSFGLELIFDICTTTANGGCNLPASGTFQFGSQLIDYANCTDLSNQGVPLLTFLQESSNIRFQLPDFPYNQPGVYEVTLSLTPKTICECPLSVSIIVLVEEVTCPND